MTLTYGEALIQAKRYDEAERTLSCLENFEKKTELGPVSLEELSV